MNDFTLELFLSSDGKHTVRIETKTEAERNIAIPYAKVLYKKIIEEFGTKQEQAVKAYSAKPSFPDDSGPVAQDGQEEIPICPKHHKPMTKGQWGWYCKSKDDSQPKGWCTYKPK